MNQMTILVATVAIPNQNKCPSNTPPTFRQLMETCSASDQNGICQAILGTRYTEKAEKPGQSTPKHPRTHPLTSATATDLPVPTTTAVRNKSVHQNTPPLADNCNLNRKPALPQKSPLAPPTDGTKHVDEQSTEPTRKRPHPSHTHTVGPSRLIGRPTDQLHQRWTRRPPPLIDPVTPPEMPNNDQEECRPPPTRTQKPKTSRPRFPSHCNPGVKCTVT
ncbi:Hypothetical predicted protein [Pelobates cultripes]|uniref:Uncharacterized protein n=1 Tax=Pelobates cultripes TaxID=61616 RepID=A0AAD1RCZ5_PELCU|nr:Hypothetical predicted protein [Pelobates cultripes]